MEHFSTVRALASFVKQFIHLNVVIVLLLVFVWIGHSGATLRASTNPFLYKYSIYHTPPQKGQKSQ